MKTQTMYYTHQEIGGYDKNDKTLYPREGVLKTSDIYEHPAYSGKYQYEILFEPADKRLPNKGVGVVVVPNTNAVIMKLS